MPRVLITGAAGFIGMHTAIRFIQDGWDVIGLDNFNEYYSIDLKKDRCEEIVKVAKKEGLSFSMYYEDLNSQVWNELLNIRIDAFIHLAAQAGVRYSIENPRAYLDSNILGFQSVLEFVKAKKIKKFIYASSSSVYGKNSKQPFTESQLCNTPESYYAATKKANELMAYSYFKTEKVCSIGLRFFTVYGPWGRPDMAPMLFMNAAMKNDEINIFNFGKQKRDFTYVKDIVESIYKLIIEVEFTACEVLNIGNGKPIGLESFIDLIERFAGVKIKRKYVEAQKGDVTETFANINLLREKINYVPQTKLEDGLESFVSWYKSYYGY